MILGVSGILTPDMPGRQSLQDFRRISGVPRQEFVEMVLSTDVMLVLISLPKLPTLRTTVQRSCLRSVVIEGVESRLRCGNFGEFQVVSICSMKIQVQTRLG